MRCLSFGVKWQHNISHHQVRRTHIVTEHDLMHPQTLDLLKLSLPTQTSFLLYLVALRLEVSSTSTSLCYEHSKTSI